MSLNLAHYAADGATQITGRVWPAILAGKPMRFAGTATAGGASTITLPLSAEATDAAYATLLIVLTGGTGSGQVRTVSSYVGSTRVATVDTPWTTVPNATTQCVLFGAEKFAVENIGSREATVSLAAGKAGDSDGVDMVRWALDTATLSRPFGVTVTTLGSGGSWGATGQRGYRVTALNATGETIGSLEVVTNVAATTERKQLDWTAVTGATSYKVYRTDTPGTYPASSLVATEATNQYIDAGGAAAAGTPPAANTTGGIAPSYGSPLAMAAASVSLGLIAVGEQKFYWWGRDVPASTVEEGNDRVATRVFTEV
jgi:hypothetical protein